MGVGVKRLNTREVRLQRKRFQGVGLDIPSETVVRRIVAPVRVKIVEKWSDVAIVETVGGRKGKISCAVLPRAARYGDDLIISVRQKDEDGTKRKTTKRVNRGAR